MRGLLPGAVAASLLLASPAGADPCGMVPPLRVSDASGPAIARVGVQRTYVAYRDGIETMVLRPGFEGRIDDFGMLIPFPSPPAIRKVDDDTFAHIEAALVPPTVSLSIQRISQPPASLGDLGVGGLLGAKGASHGSGLGGGGSASLGYSEVRVVREEAIGMYEVAVLEAGSPAALRRWMGDSGYRYPEGMDDVTAEYVEARWCFVAIKAKIGAADQVTPRPGMRDADPTLPTGATFSGHVQGMGFRFETDAPVIPMRLSVFNGPDPRNVVYTLSDTPLVISGLPASVQVRHRSGSALHAALTGPLALAVTRGELSWLDREHRAQVHARRDATAYVRAARDLLASDLLAMRTGQLALTHEDEGTALLNISEALGLRGAEMDALHAEALAAARSRAVDGAIDDVHEMHMTVMDGVFPEALLREQDLTFSAYTGPRDNADQRADALQPGGITGHATINTATGATALWWQQPQQRAVSGQVSAPQLLNRSGPLDGAAIQRALRRHQSALRYCYTRSLQKDPRVSGHMVVRVLIGPGGTVQSTGITQGLGDPQLDQCVTARIRRMRFPSSDAATLVQVQLAFSPDF